MLKYEFAWMYNVMFGDTMSCLDRLYKQCYVLCVSATLLKRWSYFVKVTYVIESVQIARVWLAAWKVLLLMVRWLILDTGLINKSLWSLAVLLQ